MAYFMMKQKFLHRVYVCGATDCIMMEEGGDNSPMMTEVGGATKSILSSMWRDSLQNKNLKTSLHIYVHCAGMITLLCCVLFPYYRNALVCVCLCHSVLCHLACESWCLPKF